MQISRFPTFSIPLKSAILAGATTISATVGVFTVIANGKEIFKSLETRYSNLKNLYENKIFPFLDQYLLSPTSSIFQKLGEWYEYLRENKEFIYKFLNPQNLQESPQIIWEKIRDWYEPFKQFLVNLFSNLNEEKIRKMIYTLSKITNGLLGMLTVLKNFLEHLISGENEKLPPDFLHFLRNTWNLFSENTGIIGELSRQDYNAIFNHMSENPKKFSENIETLKKGERWGNYTNKHDFLKDVLPTENSFKLLLEKISQAYIECGEKISSYSHSCWGKYTTYKDMEEFLKIKDDEDTINFLKENKGNFSFIKDSTEPSNPNPLQ